jgi:hypothetical protein
VAHVFLSLAFVGYNVYYCEVWAAVWLFEIEHHCQQVAFQLSKRCSKNL